jgi:ribosome biogenesis protein ERB1
MIRNRHATIAEKAVEVKRQKE